MILNEMTEDKRIYVLQGGTASGKTTLCKRLANIGIPKVTTCTTRKPKEGERDKVDYYFIEDEVKFHKLDLLEFQSYAGNLYGTWKPGIEDALKAYDCICIILEEKGARSLKEAYPDNVVVINLPISEESMLENMIKRHDNNVTIEERKNNWRELKENLPSSFADFVLKGNDIEEKWNKLLNIVKR